MAATARRRTCVTDGDVTDQVSSVKASRAVGVAKTPQPISPGTTDYGYDLPGRLTEVSRNDALAEQLGYGPSGELAWRQVGEEFIFYAGEYATVRARGAAGCGAACVPLASTVTVDHHVLLGGTRIASVGPSRTLYYYRTRLGTVVATSVNGGVMGAQYRYDPYGKLTAAVNESATTASDLTYTNAVRLTGSLYHLKTRVYDAEARVFLQPDSVDRLRYAYVGGNPIDRSDPTGLKWIDRTNIGSFFIGRGPSEWGAVDYWPKSSLDGAHVESQDTAPVPDPLAPAAAKSEVAKTDDKIGLQQEAEAAINTEEASALADARRSNLVKIQDEARASPAFQPVGDLTHCNQATSCIAAKAGAPSLGLDAMDGTALLANQQAASLASSTNNGRFPSAYREIPESEAQPWANLGNVVIAVWSNVGTFKNAVGETVALHGHIVTVRPAGVPGDPILSGSGPLFNDIGSQVRVTRRAFPLEATVRYYTPRWP